MFENEEKKLEDLRQQLEHVSIPAEQVDGAILQGFERAKREQVLKKKGRTRKYSMLLVAALLLITLATSIRVSPAFANAIGSLPGMERIVLLIQSDKGFTAAVENNYYQEIGISQSQNGATLTIDGVVADEERMLIFYTAKNLEDSGEMRAQRIWMYGEAGKKLPLGSISYGNESTSESEPNVYQGTIDMSFQEKLKETKFEMNMSFEDDHDKYDFNLKFEIEPVKDSGKTIHVNQTVSIEGQKITVKEIKITPLRVAIHINKDPANTMKIFEIHDLALKNEKGELWTSAKNGLLASHISENEQILYMESNYFDQPKNLTLTMSKLQAMPKEESYILVDTKNKKILKQPSENYFSSIDVVDQNQQLVLQTTLPESFPYELFTTYIDATGKEFHINMWSGGSGEKMLKLPEESYTGPLKMPFSYYPRWIEEKVEIELELES